jgi:thioredoxin 1
MASEHVLEFTDQNFEAEVLQASEPVLVDFWAEWCTPCIMLGPTIDQIAADYAGKAKVGKLDIDSNRGVVEQYGISAVPTLIIFRNGQVSQKFVGIKKPEDITRAIDAAK